MTTDVSDLGGFKIADAEETTIGEATLSGSFSISFRGYVSPDIEWNADSITLESAIYDMLPQETPSLDLSDVFVDPVSPSGSKEFAWMVTFSSEH